MIIRQIHPNFPILTYTLTLHRTLKADPRFRNTLELMPGNIIISPTTMGNGSIANGHVGILGENEIIYSNNSRTGKWDKHLTLSSWIAYYRTKGGYPIVVYEVV